MNFILIDRHHLFFQFSMHFKCVFNSIGGKLATDFLSRIGNIDPGKMNVSIVSKRNPNDSFVHWMGATFLSKLTQRMHPWHKRNCRWHSKSLICRNSILEAPEKNLCTWNSGKVNLYRFSVTNLVMAEFLAKKKGIAGYESIPYIDWLSLVANSRDFNLAKGNLSRFLPKSLIFGMIIKTTYF